MLKRISDEEMRKKALILTIGVRTHLLPEEAAQAQLDAVKKEILDKLEPLEHPGTGKIIGASLILTKEEYQQLRENK